MAGYVLHTRPYRDTSLIVELLTEQLGRVAAVARGARKSRQRQSLQPFIPLLISCLGKGELKTLAAVEPAGQFFAYTGRTLFSGLYVNELIMRLLPVADPYPRIFYLYAELLAALQQIEASIFDPAVIEELLRKFEFSLLEELGYAIVLDTEFETGEPVREGRIYRYEAEQGFARVVSDAQASEGSNNTEAFFAGEELCCIAVSDYRRAATRRTAKRLIRLALRPHLGNRALKSRELFTQLLKRKR